MRYILYLLLPIFLMAKGYEEPWGKDSLLCTKAKTKNHHTLSLASHIARRIILFHQNFLSPTTGPRSSFRPTSSRYMERAIERYGFMKGFVMGCDRLLRENNEEWVYPFIETNAATYKYDPVH